MWPTPPAGRIGAMNETPAPDATPDQTSGTHPGYAAPTPPPSGMDGFFASIRRTGMVRTDERWIGGVAGGVALRLGIDPLIVRGLFGIGALLGGLGLLLYGVGWLLMPEQRDGRIHLQQLFRGDFDAAVIGGFVLVLAGFAFPDQWHWFGWGGRGSGWNGIVGLVAIAVIVALVLSAQSKNRGAPPYAGPPYGPGGVPPAGPGTPPGMPPHAAPPRSGPMTTLRPTAPLPYAGPVTPAAVRRPEGTPMYPAPPAPGVQAGPAPSHPPYGQGGPWASAPYRPVPPVPPSRPGPVTSLAPTKPAGPGGRVAGIVIALGLIALAGLLYAERVDAFDGPVLLTAAAGVVILCGIGIAIAGVIGRSSGALGALAIITILVVVPVTAATDIRFGVSGGIIGDGTYTPRTAAAAEDGYGWTVGDVTLDLTEVPTAGLDDVPIHMGAGDLRVILPEGAAYTARVRVGAGDLSWLGDTRISGVGSGWATYESPAVADGAEPEFALEISVGAGNLVVVEER